MSTPSPIELQVNDVTVSYANGMVALRDASFRLTGGAICGLVGVNGSGKSTLFKAIMDFVRPARGTVLIGGRPVRAALKANLVAYVPQAEEVDWTFPVSVWDVVLMGRHGYMNFLRRPGAEDRRIAEESLARVAMLDFRERLPERYRGDN
ncbi:MAG TPA: ATP-binding cassette domain-containing protein, partial [Lacunisphaera sp.]|nr:ATP-binding cassette domain-containing protein [Lacunisphaera sp.]